MASYPFMALTTFNFRFQLYYYSDAEFKKEERKDTVLTIDTRTKIDKHDRKPDEMDDGDLDDDMQEAPLQLAIKTKYVFVHSTPGPWFVRFSLVCFSFVSKFKTTPKYLVHADFIF